MTLTGDPATAANAGIESGTLRTSDNINISYTHFAKESDSAIIICPGFYNSKNNRWLRKTVDILSTTYDVIIFDFRGHGNSSGSFTWTAKEHLDLEAVLNYAKYRGYKHIGIVAFSLGAATAIITASSRDDIESMVLISCPSKVSMINFHFWEPGMLSDLRENIECGWEGKGARIGNIFLPKVDPVEAIGRIKNTSTLFIHGDNDWVVKDCHSKVLYKAAHGKKDLTVIKGGLHAERLIQYHPEEMKKLIIDWFFKTLA